jgi:uncharacterized protein YjbI with pentapeptide repeats
MKNIIRQLASQAATKVTAMGRISELPSIKPRPTTRRHGLRKLSPDLIGKARHETATQVSRVGLTFVGTAAFCLLSLLSPDSALLGGSEKINVPFAGPVSFFGFMLLGPAVLIALRVYLEIYVEHGDRLDRLARSVSAVRAPNLVPLQNSVMRLFSGLIYYALLPVTMLLFAWKAAVFPAWGSGLFSVAAAVIASHVMLRFRKLSWRSRGLLSVSVAIIAGGVMFGLGPPRRPFDLYHANLSGQWFLQEDLRKANLESADLSNANLSGADLSSANLSFANLSDANLSGANLSSANLGFANLSDANLDHANLSSAYLLDANLSSANVSLVNLSDAFLNSAKLRGANVSYADLPGAKLEFADLADANLSGAHLNGAILSFAHLNGANLSLANLSGANLAPADLEGADLTDANLTNAYLRGADLTGADLSGVKNLTQTQLHEACGGANTKLPQGFILISCNAR